MKTSTFILFTALTLTTIGTAIAQPANNSFGNAILITDELTTGSNVGASRQAKDPIDVQHDSSRSPLGGRSVWWKWVAPGTGRYTFKTGDRSGQGPNSDFDTQLGIYTGATLGTLVEVASNEDNVFYPNGLSSAEINAVGGQTYHILIDGYAGQTGTVQLYVLASRMTLSVSVNPPGAGSVSFDPPFEASGYPAGTVVTLQATPNTSTNFYAWSGHVAGRTNPITFVMNGNKSVVANFFTPPEPVSGDAQLVVRNTNGRIVGWNFEQTNFVDTTFLGSAASDWQLRVVQDLNANGSGDFVFQHRDGRIAAWYMNDNIRAHNSLLATLPTTLRLVGAGDFNYDTQPDLLFRRSDGKLQARYMNGGNVGPAVALGSANIAWRAVTVADFNNDGSADIFFQHQDGRVVVWMMNGNIREASFSLGKTQWRFVAVRDLNNDSNPDLIFQRNGRFAAWLMDGMTRSSSILLRDELAVINTWNVVGTR